MRKTEEILRSLLHQKGMDSQEDISEFLSDRPQKTYDPFLLYNMEAGVDLLLSEIKKDTKVCIYGIMMLTGSPPCASSLRCCLT